MSFVGKRKRVRRFDRLVEEPAPAMHADGAVTFALGGQIQGLSEEFLQALPIAIYRTDALGFITAFNDAAVQLWGCRPILGKSRYFGSNRLYSADGAPLPLDQSPMAIMLRERKPVRGMEVICERPDGTRVALVPYPTPLFDDSRRLIGAINIVIDVTERKRAEEVYAFTDRLYRAKAANEIYDVGLDSISRGLGCNRAAVLLADDEGVMHFAAWRHLSDGYRAAVAGHSPWGRDGQDPEPICIADVETVDLPEPLKAVLRAEGVGALAFIPLVASGVLIGKFMAYYDAPHVFTETDMKLALTIARQLGFGIERMRAEHASRLLASIIA